MTCLSRLLIFLSLGSSLLAQEIERSEVIHRDGRKITIEKLRLPDESKEVAEKSQSAPQKTLQVIAASVASPVHTFVVSAIVYDEQNSFVTWQTTGNEKRSFSCWSNINWNHLQGHHKLESNRGNFSFMLLPQSASIQKLQTLKDSGRDIDVPVVPELLPDFEESGARYLLTRGDENHDAALNFMEAVHELYDSEKQKLVQAHQKRLKDEHLRKHELRINPPKKPDVVIRYGRVNNSQASSKK